MLFDIKMQGAAVFYFVTIVAIVLFYAAKKIERSPVGLLMKAIKSNQTRLEYTGINARKYKLLAFVISAFYAAVAGALMVVYEPFVGHEFLGWHQSGEVVIMSVIGGVGTLIGPMLGAGFMLYFENVLSVDLGEQWLLVLGAIFMAVVIFMPGGFMEGVARLKKRYFTTVDGE
jgi:ABC-type branched-subunit amino acid transport system permease subunit